VSPRKAAPSDEVTGIITEHGGPFSVVTRNLGVANRARNQSCIGEKKRAITAPPIAVAGAAHQSGWDDPEMTWLAIC